MGATTDIVETDAGPVRGTVTDEYRLFQGVPYAGATGGGLRWRPPQPVPPWTEPRDATRPCSICPQQPSTYAEVASLDEDCLCLNVTAPRSATPATPRPVMVWIHGDGAIGGGSFFDGRPLALAGDVMVVTVNYRLGIFGAFGHPGLEGSGTFGLQDQQAALGWVARTGDPGGLGLPSWPRFDGAQAVPYVQSLAPGRDGIRPVDYAAEHQLDFWEATDPSPGPG